MNSIHNNDGNDKTLHEELDQLSRSYAELEQQEPPDLVNQAILNSAHRAVEKKPHWMRFGWLHGLTTTAVFVLAFSLILKQPESTPVYQQDAISTEAKTTQPASVGRKRAMASPEDNAEAALKLKSDMAPGQTRELSAAPAVMAEKEEALRESDSIHSETPPASNYASQTPPAVQESRVDDSDRSNRQEEVTYADEAAYLAEPMQKKTADLPAEAVLDAAAGMKTEPVATEKDMKELIERITRLKMDGDETWVTELAAFKKQYPDFPIPEELLE